MDVKADEDVDADGVGFEVPTWALGRNGTGGRRLRQALGHFLFALAAHTR